MLAIVAAGKFGGGGAGNPGGTGGSGTKVSGCNLNRDRANDNYKGSDGTGGLLIIFANNMNSTGKICSMGSIGRTW